MSEERAHADAVALNPWMSERDPARVAALGKLLEELGEATAIVARCLIQGVDESEPVTKKPNKHALENELADVRACIDIAVDLFRLNETAMVNRRNFKENHIRAWHQLIKEPRP